MWSDSVVVACLLLIASWSGTTDAARSRQQRRAVADPNIVLPPGASDRIIDGRPAKSLGERKFTLRHIYHHGTHDYPQLHRYLDIAPESRLRVSYDDGETHEDAPEYLLADAQTFDIRRLAKRNKNDIDGLLAHAEWLGRPAELEASDWTEDEISAPNVTDKKTILTFAKMAANAYVTTPEDPEWQPVKGGFNYTDDFGWQQDGLRGHIFADETNSTVVIGLKGTSTWLDDLPSWPWPKVESDIDNGSGTSPAVFDGSETTGNDKLNDNLFGSCCCGQGGQYGWKQVCDCMTSTYTCNSTCLVKSLRKRGHYYWAVRDLYHNVTERYPNSDVWMSGHSLGGVVSALLGLTYGLPTLTFEAFPDAMAAERLGLPTPPGYQIGSIQTRAKTGVHHFGHTADPIFMGSCNGAFSGCTIGGYAFQGVCHTGETCIYDTVGDLGWRVGIGTHKIVSVISDVIKKYDTVPGCEQDVECVDCYNWKFFESNGTETTTSSSSSSTSSYTRTRTETCKTPGWWGCLDESTTTTTTSTSTSLTSTSTCKTPGWFGCKDPTTTISASSTAHSPSATPAPTVTTTSAQPTSTSTCHTPGWFGCNDPTTTTASATATPSPSSSIASATSTSCTSKEWFGLICVDPSPVSTSSTSTPSTAKPTAKRKVCWKRTWYGTCEAEAKVDL